MHLPSSNLRLPANAFEPGYVATWFYCVGHILRLRRFTEVVPFAIRWVPILMIDLILRPLTRHIKERQSMGPIKAAFNSNEPIAVAPGAPSFVTKFKALSRRAKPVPLATIWVIPQKHAQTFSCKRRAKLALRQICGLGWLSHGERTSLRLEPMRSLPGLRRLAGA